MSKSSESTQADWHSQGISRDRIRYLFKQHWVESRSQQGLVAPEVSEVTHYFGTRPISWMGPLITGAAPRCKLPSESLALQAPENCTTMDEKCKVSDTTGLTSQRNCFVSRGSRAEYLYKQHWLCSKETRPLQTLHGTQFHNCAPNAYNETLEAKVCEPKPVKNGMSLHAIPELELLCLNQTLPLKPEDLMNASSPSLLENKDKPRRVGQRLSELASKGIKMEADLVLLAELSKVRYALHGFENYCYIL
jgi:hypothetical protein